MTVNTIILVFVWEFIVLLSFVSFNTLFIGQVVPILNETANSIDNFDLERYARHETQYISVFYVVFFILIILPFVYLAMWLYFRREPGAGREVFTNGVSI